MNNNELLKKYIVDNFSSIKEYSGTYTEMVNKAFEKDVKCIEDCFNSKYYGWVVYMKNGNIHKIYIPMNTMKYSCDYRFAKILVFKEMKIKK